MSVSDELMWRYIELLSFEPEQKIQGWRSKIAAGGNPRDLKALFAKEIVARFHGAAAAQTAEAQFEQRFRHGALPEDMPEITLQAPADGLPLTQALKRANLVASASEAERAIEQGGVRIDGERVSDRSMRIPSGRTIVVQVGKRKFARVRIT